MQTTTSQLLHQHPQHLQPALAFDGVRKQQQVQDQGLLQQRQQEVQHSQDASGAACWHCLSSSWPLVFM